MQTPRFFEQLGLRAKLIVIFVAIKVVPLVLLAWYAWQAVQDLGHGVSTRAVQMADAMRITQQQTGKTANDDAVRALDERSREAIESLTTDLARQVADFLYDRDKDLLQAADLEPADAGYRRFITGHTRELVGHGRYVPSEDGKSWVPAEPFKPENQVRAPLPDNAKDFHTRLPENYGLATQRPLFLEMSFIGLNGLEKIKVTQGSLLAPGLRDVSVRENTFVKAETYWPALTKLKPGEIYVSEVIGAYVPTQWIGPYTKARAEELKKPFTPEASGYAGLENPVGKRFQGIVRWATPVQKGGRVVGYVTLALDHAHLMAFTNKVRPTPDRFAPIADPASGNYAFMWDSKSRAIAHPRDYFIVGYDPQTGQPAAPWMDQELWASWQASGKPWHEFQPGVLAFQDQSLKRKPAPESSKSGSVALDCRYLNFSPQCHGWDALTEHGDSGSFAIFFSGLWKLTTAATIPYYTGPYAQSKRGFGYVTIGANVDDFHKAATESGKRIDALIAKADVASKQEREGLQNTISTRLRNTALGLTASTLVMIALVIAIAIWMASALTRRITEMSAGISRFQGGDLSHRLEVRGKDEMAELAKSFNHMASEVQHSFGRLDDARQAAEQANRLKSEFLANMSHELRTPLNGILGYAELLELELEDPAQRDYAKTIRASGEHLLTLVTDVLDLAKIEAGRMDFNLAQVDLPSLLTEVVGLELGHAKSKDLRIELQADALPPLVFADPVRLRQVLLNLTSNALKFTTQGGVLVRAAQVGDRVRIEVQDTGVGIKPDDLQLIFEKFRQTEAFVTRSQQGTGLGLTLAKELVQRMGGQIGVTSSPGEGSTFYVDLPAANDSNIA
ncbi:MAG: HAMP domain-containing sensor histidine kinase [Rhodoferax sp.]|uniref:sensor histidine kinase n=1 Tax=Rhodoferax sp. TaxID=50421 RepID=UPI002633AB46|nr:HAMP domain-containing sensor histidine kinase [Rhodoferax sp.]MDD2879968.1 HAMP domain-containing sensor histidine kinase [Rhodoferax sp.]